jgi:hypothetical protein
LVQGSFWFFPLRERATGASGGEIKNPPDFAAGFGKSLSVIYLEFRPRAGVCAADRFTRTMAPAIAQFGAVFGCSLTEFRDITCPEGGSSGRGCQPFRVLF